eukprot:365029-Chlamydomonas_euryale.AAC.11
MVRVWEGGGGEVRQRRWNGYVGGRKRRSGRKDGRHLGEGWGRLAALRTTELDIHGRLRGRARPMEWVPDAAMG